jgi:outer membrane protein, multidrug efflux system
MRRVHTAVLLGAACLLGGCVVGPNYKRPELTPPPLVRGQQGAAEQASLADLPWWDLFQDETLQGLIRAALSGNNDLRVAAARVEQARQFAAQARAGYLPQVGGEIGLSGGRNESLGSPANSEGKQRGTVAVLVSAAWEADVWGRIRRSNDLALARYLQTEQARRGVLLSVVSAVAASYFELLALDLQLEIAHRNVKAFGETLGLFEDRLRGGKASRLETARARAAMETTAATVPELERQIALQENTLCLLLGTAPGPIARNRKLLEQTVPPDVPAGLPSTLLERRPDVLVAESAVRSANAAVGIAAAAFFPKIGLTALLGRASTPLAYIVAGQANLWSAAAIATGPIYTGGALRAQKKAAIAYWEQTRIEYERTVLAAFRDASNALITREKLEAVRTRQQEVIRALREAIEVAQQRYSAGKSSYFEVLDAQQQLFPAETALARTERDRRLALVALYQALGGGWKLTDAEWNGPAGTAKP